MNNENQPTESGIPKERMQRLTRTQSKEAIMIQLKLSKILGDMGFLIALGFVFTIITITLSVNRINLLASAILIPIMGIFLLIMAWRIATREARDQEKLLYFLDNYPKEEE